MAYRYYNNICAYCGHSFTASRPDAKYCPGHKCRKAAQRARANANRTGTEGFTPREIEDLFTVGHTSERAALAVMHVRRVYALRRRVRRYGRLGVF